MLVCLDTTVLIFTQQSEPREGQEQLWKAAQKYEEWMRESEFGILIPTPVVSEFLTGDSVDDEAAISKFERFTEIGSFDLRASELAGELRHSYWEREGLPSGLDREVLTIDMMISAIAIVNRASYLVTDDTSDFEKITTDYDVEICGIEPGPPGQHELKFSD